MGVLLAFFVGWSVGAKAGAQGFAEVVAAVKTVHESEEFEALIALTRAHAAAALQEIGKLVSGEAPLPEPVDLLERVRRMTAQRPT